MPNACGSRSICTTRVVIGTHRARMHHPGLVCDGWPNRTISAADTAATSANAGDRVRAAIGALHHHDRGVHPGLPGRRPRRADRRRTRLLPGRPRFGRLGLLRRQRARLGARPARWSNGTARPVSPASGIVLAAASLLGVAALARSLWSLVAILALGRGRATRSANWPATRSLAPARAAPAAGPVVRRQAGRDPGLHAAGRRGGAGGGADPGLALGVRAGGRAGAGGDPAGAGRGRRTAAGHAPKSRRPGDRALWWWSAWPRRWRPARRTRSARSWSTRRWRAASRPARPGWPSRWAARSASPPGSSAAGRPTGSRAARSGVIAGPAGRRRGRAGAARGARHARAGGRRGARLRPGLGLARAAELRGGPAAPAGAGRGHLDHPDRGVRGRLRRPARPGRARRRRRLPDHVGRRRGPMLVGRRPDGGRQPHAAPPPGHRRGRRLTRRPNHRPELIRRPDPPARAQLVRSAMKSHSDSSARAGRDVGQRRQLRPGPRSA